MMSGGSVVGKQGGKRWEEAEIEVLKKQRDALQFEIDEVTQISRGRQSKIHSTHSPPPIIFLT